MRRYPTAGPADGEAVPDPAARGRSRRRRLLGGAALVVAVAGVLSAAILLKPAASAPPLTPTTVIERAADGSIIAVRPPAATGRTIVAFSNPARPAAPHITEYDSASEGAYDADGAGLRVALRCIGAGTVEVDVSNDRSYPFHCTAALKTLTQTNAAAHARPIGIVVATTGPVRWGVTISTVPPRDAGHQ